MPSSYGENAAQSALYAQYTLALSQKSDYDNKRQAKASYSILKALPEFRSAKSLIVYKAKAQELAISDYIKDFSGDIYTLTRRGDSAYLVDAWGQKQDILQLRAPIFAFVPGLVFDAYGQRIGFAQGVVDSLLLEAKEKLFCVGVCRSSCISSANLPYEPNDLVVDAVVCESSLWRSRPRPDVSQE